MANEENLIPYKKGQSGNPKGRPKGSKNRSSTARKWLALEQSKENPITEAEETLSQEKRSLTIFGDSERRTV